MSNIHQRINWKQFIITICSLIFIGICFSSVSASEEMIITYRSPESENDKRYDYDNALLKLAMEKTEKEYGYYTLKPSPIMNYARAIKMANDNTLKNFFMKLSYEDRFSEEMNMAYASFPIDLGIVGYRVCFACPEVKEKITDVKTLDDLRKFTHGQGRGWSDVQILRHNNFEVHEIDAYESLFKMVAAKRFDLFCRGTNELLDEYNAHKHIDNFTYDTSISIAYPLPRFFYTHKSCKTALERVNMGLKIAYSDGSLKKLWLKNYQDSIDFVKLDKRKIYNIENPLLKKLNFDFQKYFYKPVNETAEVGEIRE